MSTNKEIELTLKEMRKFNITEQEEQMLSNVLQGNEVQDYTCYGRQSGKKAKVLRNMQLISYAKEFINKLHFKLPFDGKLIYVAHPFGGDRSNIQKVGIVLKELQEMYPKGVFISPLHCYSWMEYTEDISNCLKLLSKCDILLLNGDWENSKGCLIEEKFAKEKGIKKIVYNNMKTFS